MFIIAYRSDMSSTTLVRPKIKSGYMARYARMVTGAASGAVFKTEDV